MQPKRHVALGLHPRKRKSSATRHLDGLFVGVATKAPCALLVCPSVQGWADQAPGGDALVTLVCPRPQGRADWAPGAAAPKGLSPGWGPCPSAQPHTYQTVQSTVKALTVYNKSTPNVSTVQHNAIHGEFTHNEQYSALQWKTDQF